MAVSLSNTDEPKRYRKISLSSITNSLVRRSARQNGPSRSHVSNISDDENGDRDPANIGKLNCCASKTENQSKSIEDVAGNTKHKPGIFKTLKKKFQWKNIGTSTRPLKFEPKQTSSLDSSSQNYSPSEDSSSRSLRPPPRLCFVRDSSEIGSVPPPDVIADRLSVSEDLSAESTANHVNSEPPDALSVSLNQASPTKSCLFSELLKLSRHGWYWGPISRAESEEKLQDLEDGAFLVRDSSADRYLLSVSFRSSGKTFHSRIEHSYGLFSFYSQPGQEGFESIVELIENSMSFSKSAVFCYSQPRAPFQPAFPVRLVKPVSRFTQVRSLQYLCRFVIRENTRVDNIQKLPLPTVIKGYIEEGHY